MSLIYLDLWVFPLFSVCSQASDRFCRWRCQSSWGKRSSEFIWKKTDDRNYRRAQLDHTRSNDISGWIVRCSKLEPFCDTESGHIWRIWAEMTQTLMPKSTKVAQIRLPECNSPNSPNFRQHFAKFAAKIRQISQISFHKRALTLNTQITKWSFDCTCTYTLRLFRKNLPGECKGSLSPSSPVPVPMPACLHLHSWIFENLSDLNCTYRCPQKNITYIKSGIFKQGGTERGDVAQGEKYGVCARCAERHRTVTQVRLSPSCSWSIKVRGAFAWRYGVGAQVAERRCTVIPRGTWLSFPLVSVPPVCKCTIKKM